MAGEGKTIPKGFVHDPDKEEKEKTFIQELSEYIASVIERAKEYCMPPFTYGEDGKKIYPHDYEEANNIDLQKFL